MKQCVGCEKSAGLERGVEQGHAQWFLSQHFKRFTKIFAWYLSPHMEPGTIYFLYVKFAFQCIDYQIFKQIANTFWGLLFRAYEEINVKIIVFTNCILSKSYGNMCNILRKILHGIGGKNSAQFWGDNFEA